MRIPGLRPAGRMVRRPSPRPLGRRRTDEAGKPGASVSDAPQESPRRGLEVAAREGRPMDCDAASTDRYGANPIGLRAGRPSPSRLRWAERGTTRARYRLVY